MNAFPQSGLSHWKGLFRVYTINHVFLLGYMDLLVVKEKLHSEVALATLLKKAFVLLARHCVVHDILAILLDELLNVLKGVWVPEFLKGDGFLLRLIV